MAAAVPVYVLLRILFIKSRHMKTINYRHEFALLLFVVFICGLASITVLPESSATVSNGVHTTNLRLFNVFNDTYINIFEKHNINYFLIAVIGNIVIFMPFGFFPSLLWKGFSFKKALLLGSSCSLFIELCQLFLPRNTDVDDIWLNALGSASGYLLYKLIEKRYKEKLNLFK